jgi:hypothetical protein
MPIMLITVYITWGLVTKRCLLALQTDAFVVQIQPQEIESQLRWSNDTGFQRFHGVHFIVAILAGIGLCVWSFGFPLFLASIIGCNRKRLQEHRVLCNFAFFYNGLETPFWWWDILLKRMDVLLVYLAAYIRFTPDAKGTLVLLTSISSVSWALHARIQPYDARANFLVGRLESAGLRTRFGTLFVLQVLLLARSNATVNMAVAILLVVFNSIFLITVAVSFIIATGAFDGADGAKEIARGILRSRYKKMIGSGSSSSMDGRS